MENKKHCTNCKHFTWWDGDYCCTAKMKLIEYAPKGNFWCPFPRPNSDAFHADKCDEYETDQHPLYENAYNEFIRKIKENGDENLSVAEYEQKYLKEKEPQL